MADRRLVGGIVLGALGAMAVSGALIGYSTVHPGPPVPDPDRRLIACVGDSITFGAGVLLTRRWQSYPAYLQKLVPHSWQVLNFGLSGRTLMASGDTPYTAEKAYAASRACDAEAYIIMLGTNDSKPYNWEKAGEGGCVFEEELEALVRGYLALPGHPRAVLMQPPRVFEDGAYDIRAAVVAGQIHGIVARVAERCGTACIDLHALTEGHPEWFGDGVHPNAPGNEAIAQHIYEQVLAGITVS